MTSEHSIDKPTADELAQLESTDIVFDEVKRRFAFQDAQIAALDGKANFGIASASILTAAVTGLHSNLSQAKGSSALLGLSASMVVDWLTLGAFLTYIVVVLTAFKAYNIRTWKMSPEPDGLINRYLREPERYTKSMLAVTIADDYNKNETVMERKIFWTKCALLSLLAEAGMLLLITVVQLAIS